MMLDANNLDVIPVYIREASFRAAYSQSANDISHMNPKGMHYMLPFFEDLLAERYSAWEAAIASGSIRFEENGVTMRMVSSAENGTATIMAPMLSAEDFVGWGGTLNGNTVFLPAGKELEISAGDVGSLSPYYLEITFAGNTVRLTSGSTGIRFLTDVNVTQYNALASIEGVTLAKGTLVVPKSYLTSLGGRLTFDSLFAADKKYLNIETGGWYATDGETATLAGSVVNIFENHYVMNYVGVGYITVTYTDGSVATFYAENGNQKSVSIYALSTNALNDISDVLSKTYPYETEDGYSPYTHAQRNILQGFLSNILEIVRDSSAESGFAVVARSSGESVEYILTYQSNMDLLTVTRADGTALNEESFCGICICGSLAQYSFQSGALLITYSEYTERY